MSIFSPSVAPAHRRHNYESDWKLSQGGGRSTAVRKNPRYYSPKPASNFGISGGCQNWSGRLNGCVAGINWTWGIFQMPSVLKVVFLSLAKGRADLGITIVAVSLDQSIFPY